VGAAFALVRTDISDTLPGVAIAISLAPPLAVVGLMVVAGFVVLVAVPLGASSYQVFAESSTIAGLRPVAEQWASAGSWQVVDVSGTADAIRIEVLGPPPGPDVTVLRRDLDRAGYGDVAVQVALVFGGARELPAGG